MMEESPGYSPDEMKWYCTTALPDLCKYTARLLIERLDLLNSAQPGSMDSKIHRDILEKELKPELLTLIQMAISLIVSYNCNPRKYYPLTAEDIETVCKGIQEMDEMIQKAGYSLVIEGPITTIVADVEDKDFK